MEGGGQIDGAVGLLAVLQHRDQGAAHGEAGAVKCMNEFGFSAACGAEAGVHAAGLEIAADGDRAINQLNACIDAYEQVRKQMNGDR